MKKLIVLFLLVGLMFTSGCSIDHHVADDYRRYLYNNNGASHLPSCNHEADYYLTDLTKKHRYEFRSATVGYANLWIVDFGKILDETINSQDIQSAFGRLSPARNALKETESLILFDLQNYEFYNYGAHVELRIALFKTGKKIFDKTYQSNGKRQGAKMFFAGVFGMKNSIQQSTKYALDDIFTKFITDLNDIAANPNERLLSAI